MSKIVSKIPHSSNFEGWEIKTEDGAEWSVRDFGGDKWAKTYIYSPEIYLNTYRGWEAYNGEDVIRRKTEEEIIKAIIDDEN